MQADIKSQLLQSFYYTVENAANIHKHVEFFKWLQNDIAKFIPHDMLLAVWGDFSHLDSTHKPLHYDLASGIDGINTSQFIGTSIEANRSMMHLHHLWLKNHRKWFVIEQFSNTEFDFELRKIFHNLTSGTHSLLVYGVSDLRGGNDCLYVFFSRLEKLQVEDAVMQCLMPHVDHVLRRIQHLESPLPIGEPEFRFNMLRLSERELEVVDWIKLGKSNQEIAEILDVSVNTVKTHVKRIFQKLNVTKRAQAVALLSSHY